MGNIHGSNRGRGAGVGAKGGEGRLLACLFYITPRESGWEGGGLGEGLRHWDNIGAINERALQGP